MESGHSEEPNLVPPFAGTKSYTISVPLSYWIQYAQKKFSDDPIERKPPYALAESKNEESISFHNAKEIIARDLANKQSFIQRELNRIKYVFPILNDPKTISSLDLLRSREKNRIDEYGLTNDDVDALLFFRNYYGGQPLSGRACRSCQRHD